MSQITIYNYNKNTIRNNTIHNSQPNSTMDINSIFVLLKSHQNDDNSVTCLWDFNDAGYVDSEGYEQKLSANDLTLQALYVPDRVNPLITQLPQNMQFEKEGKMSKLYKASQGNFTIGEILEAVRSFIEQIYNEKYSNNRYTFKDLYFEGITGSCGIFEIQMEAAGRNIINSFGGINQLMEMMADMM